MGVVRLWGRSELRRRWAQHLTIALLIGFVGAAVLTCAAAARRTSSAYTRFTERLAIADIESPVAEDKDPAAVGAAVRGLDGVATAGIYDALFAGPDDDEVLPGNDFLVFVPVDDDFADTVERALVVDGRLPNPSASDEVLVNERAVKRFGWKVGDQVPLRSISIDEAPFMLSGDFAKVKFLGPKPTVKIVGIGRARVDLTGSTYVQQYALASRAFAKRYAPETYSFGPQLDARLASNVDRNALMQSIGNATGAAPHTLDESGSALQDTARIQAIAIALIGLTALLAGAFVISQAIGRMMRASRADLDGLRELGVDRSTAIRAASAAYLPATLAGAVVAIVGAIVGSRWFPTGLLAKAEVSPGVRIDPLVIAAGVAIIVVLALARVVAGAIATTGQPRSPRVKLSWSDRVGASLSPANATGVRWAVGRAEGTRPLAGILAAVVGVAGLLAVATYTNQLRHVVDTPAAYGNTADSGAEIGDPNEPDTAGVYDALRNELEGNPAVDDLITYTVASRVDVDGTTMQHWSFEDLRGHIEPTVVRGRMPARNTEALLGTLSARDLGVGIGDTVRATGTKDDPHELTVVGFGLFPNSENDEIATGLVTTPATLTAIGPEEARLGMAFNWKPGTDINRAVGELGENGIDVTPTQVPPDVANMRAVRAYPWWLAAFLVVLAMLATTNALVLASRRRRHEMAILGAIGFSRGQLRRASATQGMAMGLLAALVGVPLGLLVGKWVWTTHADRIGLSTAITLPIGVGLAIAAVTVVLTCLIAVASGWRATRGRLATALRTE